MSQYRVQLLLHGVKKVLATGVLIEAEQHPLCHVVRVDDDPNTASHFPTKKGWYFRKERPVKETE